jgi:hypothetical protein
MNNFEGYARKSRAITPFGTVRDRPSLPSRPIRLCAFRSWLALKPAGIYLPNLFCADFKIKKNQPLFVRSITEAVDPPQRLSGHFIRQRGFDEIMRDRVRTQARQIHL